LSDLDQQCRQIALGVSGVGRSLGRLDVDPGRDPAGQPKREGLQHAERCSSARLHAFAPAHGEEHLVGELGEGLAEVPRAHLLDLVASPARLAGKRLELEQKDGLADPAQPRVDQAPLRLTVGEPPEQHPERVEVAVAAGEPARLDSRSGRIGIESLVHLFVIANKTT
jgi:hypothetical protein